MHGFYKHPNALVETDNIGQGTRIWAFAHVLPGAVIGEDCNICDGVFVENDVIIGNRVTLKCGVQIWDGLRLEDDVFIGPNATFTNDMYPRSRKYLAEHKQTIVRRGASVGANATVLPGLTIGKNAMVGAGAVVTCDVPANAIVVGNPASIIGYSSTHREPQEIVHQSDDMPLVRESIVTGVTIHRLPYVSDIRGGLSFAEYDKHIPFRPQRYFLVYNVPSRQVRGEHAHRELQQFLVCVKGTCSVLVDNGVQREEVVLDSPQIGLYLPSMVWGVQYKYSSDAILLVLASDTYKPEDYIRDYDDYLAALERKMLAQ
jgi:UDP-2-acetamido-3-amino-2,3-dideoxy-glucuronate N-acetyltransferase